MSNVVNVTGNVEISGVVGGNNSIGGGAASIQGYTTGSDAGVFAFKYDSKNFGNEPGSIQIWNSSTGVFKTFVVGHPTDTAKYLVHATLEGPEGAVYYRGTGRLENGRAEVSLPPYFEAFTREEGRTVILTNVDGFDPLAVQKVDGRKISNSRFIVVSSNPESTQEFDWEVKATRADGDPLNAEPNRDAMKVAAFGPYAFEVR
ncbi:MAG TPA: hypothetical protein VGJ81_14315 [Thermoanaerobaculia bacterium]|jgi:hypothetical protein